MCVMRSPVSRPALLTCLPVPAQVEADKQLYRGQAFVQVVLLLIALVCVPWMLCTRPYLEYREMHKIKEQGYQGIGNGNGHQHDASSTEDETDGEGNAHEGHAVAMTEEAEEEGHDLGEIIIHQVIRASPFPPPLRLSPRRSADTLTLARAQTRSSSASAASPTRPRTSDSGPSHSLMRNSPKCCGT